MTTGSPPTDLFESTIADAKVALRDNLAARERHALVRREMWDSLLGPLASELVRNRELAFQYLSDQNAKTRLGALSILMHQGPMDAASASACECLARNDPNEDVRELALIGLGKCHAASDDIRIGALLASILNADDVSERLKKAAYFGLFEIRGVPVQAWPDCTVFQFPKDVDWAFVRTFDR